MRFFFISHLAHQHRLFRSIPAPVMAAVTRRRAVVAIGISE